MRVISLSISFCLVSLVACGAADGDPSLDPTSVSADAALTSGATLNPLIDAIPRSNGKACFAERGVTKCISTDRKNAVTRNQVVLPNDKLYLCGQMSTGALSGCVVPPTPYIACSPGQHGDWCQCHGGDDCAAMLSIVCSGNVDCWGHGDDISCNCDSY